MDLTAWILSGLLAAFFLFAGGNKLAVSRAKLLTDPRMGWADDFSEPQIKLIAAIEVLGAVGLIVPWALDVAPVLTPLAAVGLAITMALASLVHLRRGERASVPVNAVVLGVAAVVAVIRFGQL